MKPAVFVGMVVMLAGYTLGWWGWRSLQGPGIGLRDLITPSLVGKVDAARAGNPNASSSGSTSNGYANTPGTITGNGNGVQGTAPPGPNTYNPLYPYGNGTSA